MFKVTFKNENAVVPPLGMTDTLLGLALVEAVPDVPSQARNTTVGITPSFTPGMYLTLAFPSSNNALEELTEPIATQLAPLSVENSQVPLPAVASTAIPSGSFSASETETEP